MDKYIVYQGALMMLTTTAKLLYINDNKKIPDSITESTELLQELVNQTKPQTLGEIKQEWEASGWNWEEDDLSISLTKSSRVITIYKHNKIYDCTRHNMCKVGALSIQEHQLLTKTFRALGWI